MESEIVYKEEHLALCEDFTDVGYMADNFEAMDFYGNLLEIKRSHPNKSMTLLVSFPAYDERFKEEILKLDAFLNLLQVDVNCYLIFDFVLPDMVPLENKLTKFTLIFDTENEFGSMYGTKIVSGSLTDKLTKSLFLISKDGAIFYIDMPMNLETPLNLDRLQIELNKAYISYTGVGCHE
jgi:peroxiredoxin